MSKPPINRTNKHGAPIATIMMVVAVIASLMLVSCTEQDPINNTSINKSNQLQPIKNKEDEVLIKRNVFYQTDAFLNNQGGKFCNTISLNSKKSLFKQMQREGQLSKKIVAQYNQDQVEAINKYCPKVANIFIRSSKKRKPNMTQLFKNFNERVMNESSLKSLKEAIGPNSNVQEALLIVPISKNNANSTEAIPLVKENGKWLSRYCYLIYQTKESA